MKNKSLKYKANYKKFISIITLSIIFILLSFNFISAQESMENILYVAGDGAGFSQVTNTSASEYVGSIIQYLLSFLGVIFIVLIIYAGFLWMTARGDSEQITKAKDIIISSIIGLTIVVSAYTLTYYLLANIFI